MSFYKMELFGHVVYSPALSYHDLLDREERIKLTVQNILEKAQGEFIHFEALGDTLRFQCVLPEEKEDVFHTICDDLAPHMKNGLDARLLVVDKDLDAVYCYVIVDGKWQESAFALPPSGKLAKADPVNVDAFPTDHAKQRPRKK
ncbi:MAG: hypothetical protein DELT_00600 [Desulfovibrio sp.]